MKTKILMHKDVETAIVLQSENNIKIKEIINKEHLPIGVYNDNQILMDKLAAIWSNDRIIPNDRQNLDAIINRLGTTVSDAYVKSLGVSLTDCYWFKEENSKLRWSDVNFYDNGFAPAFDNGTCLGSYRIDEDGNVSSIIHKTNKIKDMFSNRNEILDYIGNDIVNYNLSSFAELNIILKKYYGNYDIPEYIYHIAEEELKDG